MCSYQCSCERIKCSLYFIFLYPSGLDVPKVLSLLINAVSEFLPNLTPVLRQQLILFLSEMCVSRLRLFQAVLNMPTNIYTKQLHLEVELPPIPCPLTQVMKLDAETRIWLIGLHWSTELLLVLQGVNLLTWEQRDKHAQLISSLREKEEELRSLRNGLRVTLREVSLPENEELDTQVRLVQNQSKHLEWPVMIMFGIVPRAFWN